MKNRECTIVPVVLCGGSGTRLWPLSRSLHPKQLLSLVNEQSLLQNTLLRTQALLPACTPFVVCNQEYRFVVAEQIRQTGLDHTKIVLEPEGRNTAPAITCMALHLQKEYADPFLLVMPSDHVIVDDAALKETLTTGMELALADYLVTFGIVPNKPETGYGYILKEKALGNKEAYKVARFVEKPALQKAEEYVASGHYFWNSGMFLFKASVFLEAMQQFAPDIYTACEQAVLDLTMDFDYLRFNESFLAIRNDSIDFAVMEKAQNIAVIPLHSEWSDVGSWDVLWNISQKDNDGNVLKGSVVVDQVSNSYLRAEKRTLAVVGLSDIAVVETSDAVLVAHKNHCQHIKSLVGTLKSEKQEVVHTHDRVYRPWGYYEVLAKAEHYQIKHIQIKPHAKISLQLHRHRSEHWIIIKGIATITRAEEQLILTENESVYIPANTKHRIENNTSSSLYLVEVQTGSYLGEDDIIRFEDLYGR